MESKPFPTKQMLILAICRICEPIAFMGIFPYVYFMVKDFQMTDDNSKISLYAGMITAAFTFAEFSTGLLWGRLSDRIGRKPVLLTGMMGTAISVLVFGFSSNLYVALAARAIGGLLNGNMGVLQSTIAEVITDKAHQPRAYTIMPVVWCIGSIVGPMIGGALAKPVESYPSLFAQGTVWDSYPYLLPNLFSALICIVGVVNGILFLEETHSTKKHDRDRGLDGLKHDEWSSECQPLLDEQLPGYRTTENSPENSPRLPTTHAVDEPRELLDLDAGLQRDSKIFTRPVILNVAAFGILAFHTMTYDSLFPTFLSTPHVEKPTVQLPFKFADGLAMPQQEVGIILSVQGIYALLLNVLVVPWAISRFGPLRLFRFLAVGYFLLYLITPYIVLLPTESLRTAGIYVLLIWKCTFANMSYPSNAILTANHAPSKHVLGNINGVAASTASLSRGFAPIIGGMLYSVGLETGYSGLAWWCSALVAVAGAVVALRIPEAPAMCEKSQDDIEAQAS
ncbi:major facilitator superfamily domain-containing protein [Truncatella angustata]|uniref:Major facilitator superfamily domain-containing protein n=1 Tax=Truncatella angustata TaxID=152316 RepID=A0A9P8UWZ1_9PEZI|nr:major facilitator superfamily domain-containing protein [Truncatella angustata]KAH6659489.1 major facilitator superfamily domain-containing protein [Truncatella angustata]